MAKVNYFGLLPFCPQKITDGSLVGYGTNYPLGLDIYGITYFYWKIKTFNSIYSASALWGGVNASGHFSGNLTTTTENTGGSGFNPQVETDLICSGLHGSLSQTDGGNVVNFANGDAGKHGANVGLVIYYSAYLYNNIYYPKFVIQTGVLGDDGLYYGATGPFVDTRYTLTKVCNATINLGSYGSASFNVVTADGGVTGSGSLIISSGDIWPYNP
jgi:hypothetical protein